jgi:protein involved in sex pheromone biosynthesis
MNKKIKLIVLASTLIFGGCAGLSQQDKAESVAFKTYQKSDAKVERKTVKLGLATTASALALKNVVESTKELNIAKQERQKAKDTLESELGFNP